jgi:hypothetical protein
MVRLYILRLCMSAYYYIYVPHCTYRRGCRLHLHWSRRYFPRSLGLAFRVRSKRRLFDVLIELYLW